MDTLSRGSKANHLRDALFEHFARQRLNEILIDRLTHVDEQLKAISTEQIEKTIVQATVVTRRARR